MIFKTLDDSLTIAFIYDNCYLKLKEEEVRNPNFSSQKQFPTSITSFLTIILTKHPISYI